jgi:hypothetical protein
MLVRTANPVKTAAENHNTLLTRYAGTDIILAAEYVVCTKLCQAVALSPCSQCRCVLQPTGG